MGKIWRVLVGVFPFFRTRLLTRGAQYGITYGRNHFSKGYSKSARQVSRVAFSAPSNRRSRSNDGCLVRQDFCLFLAMSSAVGELSEAIRERDALVFNCVSISDRIQVASASQQAVTYFFARVVCSNVFCFMDGRFKITRFIERCCNVRDGTTRIIRVLLPNSHFCDVMRLINYFNDRVFS